MSVPVERAEQARALMLELFPEGFEEADASGGVELVAYTTPGGEERLWQAFGGAVATDVDEDWADRWRRFHRPVEVAGLWIGPPWEPPPEDVPTVVIDPGRAFGTGAHPTTRLCVELLARVPRGSVLDVGCGSGVLAIAAARLGHGPLVGVDVDPVAVEAARENARANGVELDARVLDATLEPLPKAELAVANIALEPVVAIAGRLDSERVITSGYLVSDEPDLTGFRVLERVEAEGWAADLHLRA